MKLSKKSWLVTLLLLASVTLGNAGAEVLPSAAPGTDFIFTRNLMLGVRGGDVSALQQFLIAGSFLKVSTSTGYFGSLTKTALGAWQASVGVYPSTGFFGPISMGKINAAVQAAPTNETSTVGATATTTGAITPTIGTTSTTIANNENGSPVRLTIPKLNINAGFQYNGLKPDGTIEVPSNIYDVGWFTGSARPGEKGVAIVTGHVAQIRRSVVTKPGVFSNLSALSVGDRLSVVNDKGESFTFVVREIRTYDPSADATDVFTSNDGGAHLNLITCEGSWDQAQLSYTQRLVVFTDAAQ